MFVVVAGVRGRGRRAIPCKRVILPISGPHGMRISTSMGSITSILKRPAGAKAYDRSGSRDERGTSAKNFSNSSGKPYPR
jgi:hypothetical protein